ncbi:pheromone autoinducer 2 transporter [Planctomycetes bacterium Poly30]|uniref:Pheromone autoinducer 2 transporter n=1 Tax=Saltatorellus ferox TaxID=2528018 RepID=A0A518ERW9_9BACT|nr:pheromone autoinducer 2 transporter [Planctomycetes bacterium Poly30]
MLERLSKTHRNIALIAIGLLLAWFAWTVRSVLNPLILGYLLAYILRPLVQKLQDRGMGRRPAVNIIFVVFGLLLLTVGGAVFIQARQFVENQIVNVQGDEDLFTRAQKNIDGLLGRAGSWMDATFRSGAADALLPTEEPASTGESDDGAPRESDGDATAAESDGASDSGQVSEGDAENGAGSAEGQSDDRGPAEAAEGAAEGQAADGQAADGQAADGRAADGRAADGRAADEELTLASLLKAWTSSLTNGDSSGLGRAQVVLKYVQRFFGGLMSFFGFLMLLPVYTYFLLFELERIHEFVRMHVPKRERERVTRIGRQVGSVIANFFRGRLLICLLKGLVLAIGLTILQIPYGFLLGMVSGFLSLVPFVGPMIGFVMTFLISLQGADTEGSGIWVTLAILGGIFMLAEVLEGYVFIPKILGDSLGLHPVVILLSVFVGGAALGFFGMLIAIPLAAALIILFRELVMPALNEFAEEDSHVDGPYGGPPEGGGSVPVEA